MQKRLYRSRKERMIGGVCGGLAQYFNIDPVIVRIIAVLLIFVNGIGLLAYLIMAIVVPLESTTATEPREVIRENVQEIKETATQVGKDIKATFTEGNKSQEAKAEQKAEPAMQAVEKKPEEVQQFRQRGFLILGVVVIVVGILFLIGNLNFFSRFYWNFIWPVILVIVGLLIIFGTRQSRK
jgi:phage shock protein C